ncbi:hypothetical protein [Eubacterium sp.]|uniref:hypothetical protein n=1 Tax=Eubacterium sp. TaxID=142586 RepID=UPI0035212194
MSVAKKIENYCKERNIQFINDYSGRNMFGRKCVGYICNPRDKYSVFTGLESYLKQKNIDISKCRILEDNMAKDMIIYFPNICL